MLLLIDCANYTHDTCFLFQQLSCIVNTYTTVVNDALLEFWIIVVHLKDQKPVCLSPHWEAYIIRENKIIHPHRPNPLHFLTPRGHGCTFGYDFQMIPFDIGFAVRRTRVQDHVMCVLLGIRRQYNRKSGDMDSLLTASHIILNRFSQRII